MARNLQVFYTGFRYKHATTKVEGFIEAFGSWTTAKYEPHVAPRGSKKFVTQVNALDKGDNGEPKPFTVPPDLKHVAKLPIVGSMLPWYSNVPDTILRPYDFWPEMNKRYGGFYTVGIPGPGRKDDLFRTLHVITDPREMLKILRSSEPYPSGILEAFCVNQKWMKSRGLKTTGLFQRGPEWKRLRSFLQRDLLHPDSARGFVPAIIEAARLASQGAAAASSDMDLFFQRCAFDMFSSAMLGELTQTADSTTSTDPENERFVASASKGLGLATRMVFDPKENILGNFLGIETSTCRKAFEGFDEAWAIGKTKMEEFTKLYAEGELNELQQSSYLSKALLRQTEEGANVSIEEVHELTWTGLFAAVDTTSSTIRWIFLHLATNPEVQEKLYQELCESLRKFGNEGKISAQVLEKKNVPYLHAVINESTRLTPALPIFLNKTIESDKPVPIHKTKLRKGDVAVLEVLSTFQNPELFDNPDEFQPERWLQDEVEKRKGTYREIVDHNFLKESFSQGSRKCPGSRVAINEIQVMVAQLVVDWQFSLQPHHEARFKSWRDIPYQRLTTIEPILPPFSFTKRNY